MSWNPRTERLYWRRRLTLIDLLAEKCGGKVCARCGADGPLEIHHIYGRSWHPRKTSSTMRLRIYLQEAERGLLSLLCPDCNAVTKPVPY